MSQSPLFQSAMLVRLRLTLFVTSLLVLPTTSSAAQPSSSDSVALSQRRVSVICDLNENEPPGTLVTRLLDHNLTLKNFRAAEPDPAFSVDPHDGSVRIDRDDQIDFELHRSLQFRVSADETPAERDQFLEEFSAGLLEDGLTAGAIELISSETVTFDITIRIADVPEPPALADVNLVVQVFDASPAEIGTVAATGSESSENLKYFIISGNEDDLFQINADTGVLSLRGSEALQDEMISTHELQILAENSAGLSTTANVVVAAYNETPRIHAVATSDTTNPSDPETRVTLPHPEPGPTSESPLPPNALPFGLTLKLHYEPETRAPLSFVQSDDRELTTSGNAVGQTAAVDTEIWPVVPHFATPIPGTGPIDTVELQEWLTATDTAGQTDAEGANPQFASATKTDGSSPSPSAEEVKSESKNILQSLVVLIVFVASCVAAAVAMSRASSARRANVAAEVAKLTQSRAEDELRIDEVRAAQEVEFQLAALQAKLSEAAVTKNQDSEKIAELSESICLLQNELAARDHLIADLRAQLRRVCQGLDTRITGDHESAVGQIVASDNSGRMNVVSEVPSIQSGDSLSQILQHVESHAGVCSSLTTPHELELSSGTESCSGWDKSDRTDTDYSPVSTDSAVATLSEVTELRSELAELFTRSEASTEEFTVSALKDSAASAAEESVADGKDEEEFHLDTVKQYLARLLDRSKESTSPEEIPADRRKTEDQDRGTNRKSASEPARKPVKSFLESYMATHGGEFSEFTLDSSAQTPFEKPAEAPLPVKPRTPVDVKSVRESMNSFRAVAIQSVENAVLSHDLRLTKGAIAVRSVILAGLILLTAVAFLANRLEVIQFRLLPWLMAAGVIVAMIELGLRMHGMRQQRRGLASGTRTSAKQPEKRRINGHDPDDNAVES